MRKLVCGLCAPALIGAGAMAAGFAGNPSGIGEPMKLTETSDEFYFYNNHTPLVTRLDRKVNRAVRMYGIDGKPIIAGADDSTFSIRDEKGNILYRTEPSSRPEGYTCQIANTSRPDIRFWLISSDSKLRVVKEEKGTFTEVMGEKELSSAGILIPADTEEILLSSFRGNTLSVTKGRQGPAGFLPRQQAYFTWNGQGFQQSKADRKGLTLHPEKILHLFSISSGNILHRAGEETVLSPRVKNGREEWSRKSYERASGEKITFTGYNHFFQLTGEEGQILYTSPVSSCRTGTFHVVPLEMEKGEKFWQVTLSDETGEKGFWLIGEENGKIQVPISGETLKEAGLLPNSAGNQNLEVISENGNLSLLFWHLYWPKGTAHAQMRRMVDKVGHIRWNPLDGSFGLSEVETMENPTFIDVKTNALRELTGRDLELYRKGKGLSGEEGTFVIMP